MSNDKKWLVYLHEETNAFHSKDYDSVCLKLRIYHFTSITTFKISIINFNHFHSEMKFLPSIM